MESKCKFCGYNIGEPYSKYGGFCDGVRTLGPDPFLEEIRGDDTEYMMCSGERHDSAMEI